jgi:hypothetical protein
MKTIILILTILAIFTDPPRGELGKGCTSGTGHYYIIADSVFRGERTYYIDTAIIDDGEYEISNIVAWDTIYFTCMRCDSALYYITDTIKHIISPNIRIE